MDYPDFGKPDTGEEKSKQNFAYADFGQPDPELAPAKQSTPSEKGPTNPFPLRLGPGPNAGVMETLKHVTDTSARSIGNMAVGGAEALGAMVSGAAASAVTGNAALLKGLYKSIFSDDKDILDQMVKTAKAGTGYSPRTDIGQKVAKNIGMPFQKIEEVLNSAGHATAKVAGPEAALAVRMAPDIAMSLFGLKFSKPTGTAVKGAEQQAAKFGLDLKAPRDVQTAQLADAARSMVPSRSKGFASAEVVDELLRVKDVQKAGVDALYAKARNAGPAGIETTVFNDVLGRMVADSLKPYDLAGKGMGVVKKRVLELQEMGQKPWNSVSIKELEDWRRRVNAMTPKDGGPPQAAMTVLKAQYDAFRDAMFNANMITGDPAAVTAWKTATDAYRQYKANFSDSRVIKQLVETDANVTEVRNWIFGAGDVGLKAESATVIRRLDNLLGKNNPAMANLRQDAMLNIIDPLFDGDLARFSRQYERVMRNNRPAMDALFGNTELGELNRFAKAIHKASVPQFKLTKSIPQFIARMIAGEGTMAKGQARIGMVQNALERAVHPGGTQAKRAIIAELIDYKPRRRMFEGLTGVAATEQPGMQTDNAQP